MSMAMANILLSRFLSSISTLPALRPRRSRSGLPRQLRERLNSAMPSIISIAASTPACSVASSTMIPSPEVEMTLPLLLAATRATKEWYSPKVKMTSASAAPILIFVDSTTSMER